MLKPGGEPGSLDLEGLDLTTTPPKHQPKKTELVTINTASLKPQNESQPQANQSGTNRNSDVTNPQALGISGLTMYGVFTWSPFIVNLYKKPRNVTEGRRASLDYLLYCVLALRVL